MHVITPEWKINEIVTRYPETVVVFLGYGCPDMRRGLFGIMARLMTLRNAARVHRIPLERLLADLNDVVSTLATSRPAAGE